MAKIVQAGAIVVSVSKTESTLVKKIKRALLAKFMSLQEAMFDIADDYSPMAELEGEESPATVSTSICSLCSMLGNCSVLALSLPRHSNDSRFAAAIE